MKMRVKVWLVVAGSAALLSWSPAECNPLKTNAPNNNPISNWAYLPAGIPDLGLGPGSAMETGEDPPKVTKYVEEAQFTAAERAAIKAADLAAHPSIVFVGDPDVSYDCHGTTFKGDGLWIDNPQVATILADQGWALRAAGAHMVGDIVIYRDGAGNITHSGVVTAVAAGAATRVRSKWGNRGKYEHDIADVPPDYGAAEVRHGGMPLADPPLGEEDVNVFDGHVPPISLKPSLRETNFNDFPVPELQATVGGPFNWQYALDVPQLGMQITTGDELTLFLGGLTSAIVTAPAASASFGAWAVQSLTANSVVFRAGSSAFVPFGSLVDGFQVTSTLGSSGEIVYTESVAGSVGLAAGPVPVPAVPALGGRGMIGLAGLLLLAGAGWLFVRGHLKKA